MLTNEELKPLLKAVMDAPMTELAKAFRGEVSALGKRYTKEITRNSGTLSVGKDGATIAAKALIAFGIGREGCGMKLHAGA